ncbi:MAG: toxin HicA [Planctomycetes bacterium B3_Pla]|nr:MAG: toxin HicA [Planctomycetes bacterium B3_Pla]
MGRHEKLLAELLRGRNDANVPFDGLCRLLKAFGFAERIRGSHHIFTREGVEEIINLQPKDSKTKPYQVKQVRNIILRYKLTVEKEND